jgi:catechol 2,3-dioxygenase-like lactoylglutathione lyase family enzyme
MRLSTLTLTSRDLARSRAFYSGKLGFRVLQDVDGQSFVLDAGSVMLTVDRDGARVPLTQAEPRLVFHTDGLAQRCTTLRDLGVSVDGPRNGKAELSDPDGHPIILMER